MKTIGILGYGEIGKAIEKVYKDFNYEIKIKDINRDDRFEGIEVLNICIPYSIKFVEIVSKEINLFKPKLTIIHSTTNIGTTLKIKELIPSECYVVHSPVRGVHPELYEGIKTFVKYIGGDSKDKDIAKEHLKSLGIDTKVLKDSNTTELGKLLSTSYYGLVIAWHGEMKKMCDKYGVDFEEAITDFNKTYNKGYSTLGMNHVIRPVLYPPLNNKITGHCIISNAKLLKKELDSKFLKLILDYK